MNAEMDGDVFRKPEWGDWASPKKGVWGERPLMLREGAGGVSKGNGCRFLEGPAVTGDHPVAFRQRSVSKMAVYFTGTGIPGRCSASPPDLRYAWERLTGFIRVGTGGSWCGERVSCT
jgi:hypothetical protein